MAKPRQFEDDFGGDMPDDFGGLGPGGGIDPDDPGPGPDYGGPLPIPEEEPPFEPVEIPPDFDPNPGRGSEGPRDRPQGPSAPPPPSRGAGGPRATPRRPPMPTPGAGAPQPGAPFPTPPMGGGVVPGNARLRRAGLMGGAGGLLEGGLGTPFDPVPDEQSFDIDTLIKLLGGQ